MYCCGDLQALVPDQRKFIAVAQLKDDPIFKDFLELCSAPVKGPVLGPDSLKARNRPKYRTGFQQLVTCIRHSCLDVSRQSHVLRIRLNVLVNKCPMNGGAGEVYSVISFRGGGGEE